MPNTLVHIGINGILSKKIINKSHLFWIYVGTVIPDFPWILRKIITYVFPNVDGFDLQTYVIIQASFFFCLIFSFALSLWDTNFLRTFSTLSLGSFLHLLTDPFQIKWANGVHFFAPFNWDLINFGFFWPESWFNYLLTLLGFIYFFINRENYSNIIFSFTRNKINMFISIFPLIIYLFLPFFFTNDVIQADNHFINTIKNINERSGKYVEMDRRKLIFDEDKNSFFIETFDKSLIKISGEDLPKVNRISIRGKFINNKEIEVLEYHINNELFRDGASYLGIFLIFIFFVKNNFITKKSFN